MGDDAGRINGIGDADDAEDAAEVEGGLGLAGLGDILSQFQVAEHRLEEAAAEASATVVTGSAAGGQVAIEISGELDAVSVHIDPAVVDPSDVALLEDLVLAAIRDCLVQVAQLQAEVAGSFDAPAFDLSGLLGNLGNFGLGNLGGLGDPDHMPGFGDLSSLIGGLGLGHTGTPTSDAPRDAGASGGPAEDVHTDSPDDPSSNDETPA